MQNLGEKNLEKQEGKCPIFLLGGKEVKLAEGLKHENIICEILEILLNST